MTVERFPVVVGIDTSPGAEHALAWAVEEARSRAVALRLVHGYGALAYGGLLYGNLPVPEISHVHNAATKLLAEAAARASELGPGLGVSTHAIEDDPARVLIEESVRSSVSAAVSARAACPVVVLRGPAGSAAERAAVVVGVDGQHSSQTVLEFAFDYASRRSVPLHAVLCWHPDLLAEMTWRAAPPAPEHAEALLSEALAGWREKYPDVDVHGGVIRDHPVTGLVAASAAQDLLVVGSRGRHALAGVLLGSVSQGVLHHATCPVAVVPSATI